MESSYLFQKRKAETLAAITSQLPDKSPKGFLDTPIIPLIDAINLSPSYFTTSSCSGRISVLNHRPINPTNTTESKKKKAGGGGWIYITHDPADPDAVIDALFGGAHGDHTRETGGDLVFRFEPLIVAVECADVDSAQTLVAAAISCGFRESGITSVQRRIIIAIRCSIRMEVPLGQVGSIVVSPEYVRYLVQIANEKMEANRKRTDGFLQVLQHKVLSISAEKLTTHERNVDFVSKKGILLDTEAKRSDTLSTTKVHQIDISGHQNQHLVVDLAKNNSISGSGRHSCEDKTVGSPCEDVVKDIHLLHELEAGYNDEERTDIFPDPA